VPVFRIRRFNNEKDFLFDVDDTYLLRSILPVDLRCKLQCSWAGHVKGEEFTMEIMGEAGGAKLIPLEIYTEQRRTG
jgi:hypothetical protein